MFLTLNFNPSFPHFKCPERGKTDIPILERQVELFLQFVKKEKLTSSRIWHIHCILVVWIDSIFTFSIPYIKGRRDYRSRRNRDLPVR